MKENVQPVALKVCNTMERYIGYIKDGRNYRLLIRISTVLTDRTLLPCILDSINDPNTISMNRHCDISLKSLSDKWIIVLNTACDTLKSTTQQGIY